MNCSGHIGPTVFCQQPEQLATSRERYRFYRERGYELQIHDMKKT